MHVRTRMHTHTRMYTPHMRAHAYTDAHAHEYKRGRMRARAHARARTCAWGVVLLNVAAVAAFTTATTEGSSTNCHRRDTATGGNEIMRTGIAL